LGELRYHGQVLIVHNKIVWYLGWWYDC